MGYAKFVLGMLILVAALLIAAISDDRSVLALALTVAVAELAIFALVTYDRRSRRRG